VKFTKLRLAGFKTFVEPADLLIEPGLTGVVGPNGCGKSNLLEAMRWVMGEQASRQLRAVDMDDVIFNGSGRRAARNHAEVMLAVAAPATPELVALGVPGLVADGADTVLEITRRIERGAGSTYRLNGREVRARDVQILFADASTGARSPAMVRQGQIAELIAARPSARRAILEEASGVSGLNGRRQEAESRLKAAEQNLGRLEDVLVTLSGQLDGLDRQARQATRYRGLSAEIRALESAQAFLRWRDIQDATTAAEREAKTAAAAVAGAAAAQETAAIAEAVASAKLPEARQAEADASATLAAATRAVAEHEAEAVRVRDRLKDLAERLGVVAEDVAREERLAADRAAAVARLDAEKATLEAEATAATADTAGLAADRIAAADRLAAVEARVAAAERELAGAESAALSLARQRADARARHARLAEERVRQERALAEALARAAAVPDVALLTQTVADAAAAAETAEAAVESAVAALAAARRDAEGARSRLATATDAVSRLEVEARTLAKVTAPAAGSKWPRLLDQLTVATGYEAALAAALGDDLDAGLDARAPLRWTDLDAPDAPAPLPDGAEPLAKHVQAPPVLARRLARIGVVARADGARLQALLGPGQRLVSKAGDLWRWDGLVATAEAPTAAARQLEARNRLAEIEREAAAARVARDDIAKAETAARAALASAEAAERTSRDTVRRTARAVADARQALADAERLAAERAARRVAAEEGTARARAAEIDVAAALAQLDAEAAALPENGALKAAVANARIDLAAARDAAASARAAEDRAAAAAAARDRRLATITSERAAWDERGADAIRQRAALAARRATAEDEIASLRDRPEALEDAIAAGREAVTATARARAAAVETLAGAEADARERANAARAALAALSSARETAVRAEERRDGAVERRDEAAAAIRERFEVAPGALPRLANIDTDAPLPALAGVETRLERLRAERERLGAVNLRAEEEATEARGRIAAMTADRDDLTAAVARLRSGIREIDDEARERLAAAFKVVGDHFRTLFTELFGGGEAELFLVDGDDLLTAGLEISARPPGKKPSTMSLLSGGEQALTAIALIFAVFLTNPAPVCVLDEVDAPLDDANVERWCDLLAGMASRTATRFLVVTHNPITMARMNRLYGVTMAERGVSQLVSVDLDPLLARPLTEAGHP
jgi:chromosome segregation protein